MLESIFGEHLRADGGLYLAFLAGQLLFILKRAASAIRSKANPISSRRAYLAHNWDMLSIRAGLELPLFYVWRHYSLSSVLAFFGAGWQVPFEIPVTGITAFMFGFLADSVLDWVGQSPKLPGWLRESIPPLNGPEPPK